MRTVSPPWVAVLATSAALGSLGAPAVVAAAEADRAAPHVVVTPRHPQVRPAAPLTLRLTCPPDESRCVARLRLIDHARRTVALRRVIRIDGGSTERLSMRLARSARTTLAERGRLRLTAVASARDAAGNRAIIRTTLVVIAAP